MDLSAYHLGNLSFRLNISFIFIGQTFITALIHMAPTETDSTSHSQRNSPHCVTSCRRIIPWLKALSGQDNLKFSQNSLHYCYIVISYSIQIFIALFLHYISKSCTTVTLQHYIAVHSMAMSQQHYGALQSDCSVTIIC